MVKSVIDVETGMIKSSPAGKFVVALSWVMDRSEKLLESCKDDAKKIEVEEKVHQHVKYMFDNRDKILEILMLPNGNGIPFDMKFKSTHAHLEPLVKDDAFETATRQYQGRRRAIDMFYRDLGELYVASMRCDELYNDRFQSDKFAGIVLKRLRWIKTIEEEMIKLYEG